MARKEGHEGRDRLGRRTEERKIPQVIFDTDVLIWYLRGDPKARDILSGVPYDDRATSALCVMELVQGCLSKTELKVVKGFVGTNFSSVIYPDEVISEKAILLLERHAPADGLRTVDALIAASALARNAVLATANYKHFKHIANLTLSKFNPSG